MCFAAATAEQRTRVPGQPRQARQDPLRALGRARPVSVSSRLALAGGVGSWLQHLRAYGAGGVVPSRHWPRPGIGCG